MDIEKRARRRRTLNSVTGEGAGDGKERGFVKCETKWRRNKSRRTKMEG